MAVGELFEAIELKQCRGELSREKKEETVKIIVRNARLGLKYLYTLRETGGLLRCSCDELDTILHRYRLDAVLFLSVPRIPWYELCGYLLEDKEDDLEEALDEYLLSLPRRSTNRSKTV
jgi:hypothetical protein